MVATQKPGVTIERAGLGKCQALVGTAGVDQSRAGGPALSGLPGPWSVRCRCLGQSHREEKWGRSEGKCICLRRVTDCNCTYALSFPWTVTPLGVPKSF